MKILAVETSCDETAVAIVEDGRSVRANVVHSQIALHADYGGVVPEAAARCHIETVNDCLDAALKAANLDLDAIDCFAATLGPGLVGSLLIGANTAKTLSLLTGKPFRAVNHLFGHVASNYLQTDLAPPFLCLLVSGGHTQLIHVRGYDDMAVVGDTLDDAVGEAYDKVARLMGLPYPGGPNLDRLAQQGNPKAYPLPIARTDGVWDFSFSGLKTACLRVWEQLPAEADHEQARRDLAASFQQTVVKTLSVKTLACLDALGLDRLAIAGGVSANSAIRQHFQDWTAAQSGRQLFIPDLVFCTDNAAMIAASAFFNPIGDSLEQEVFSRQIAS